MSKLCGDNPEGWGPLSPDRWDFTLCFEYSIFYCSVSLFAILVFCFRVFYLRTRCLPHSFGRTWWIYWPSQTLMLTASIAFLADTIFEFLHKEPMLAQLTGSITMSVAWFIGILVNYHEHKYTIRSSDVLIVFYVVSIVSVGLVLHTHFDLNQNHTFDYFCNVVSLASLSLGLIIEALPRGSTRVQKLSGAQEYDKASLLSRACFMYYQPIISLAAEKTFLTPSDIVNQLPESYNTKTGYGELSTRWSKRAQEYHSKVETVKRSGCKDKEIKKIKKPSLMSTILISEWKELIPVVILRLFIPFAEYMSPALFGLLLDYIGGSSIDEPISDYLQFLSEKPLAYGLAIAFSFFALHIITSAMYGQVHRLVYLQSTKVRCALTAMIYRKALKLSPDARRESSTGAITNHMSVDVNTWKDGLDIMSCWVSLPFDFSMCLFLLYKQVGWCVLAGLSVILAFLPLQTWRAGVYERLEEDRLKASDERVRMTSEILSNSKVVKMYGWESAFKRRILAARNKELNVLRRMGLLEALMTVVFGSGTMLISLATFTAYVTLGKGVLTPKIVFVSFALFRLLQEPVGRCAHMISNLVRLTVATNRVRDFLLREEIDDNQISRSELGINAIEIRDATLSWTISKSCENGTNQPESSPSQPDQMDCSGDRDNVSLTPALRDINLTVRKGTITTVVGRVGQGKSSLLNAIAGEMYKLQGMISVDGRIAYVPQQAWIINATLRDNILFGSSYDHERYRRVLSACGLEPDLVILPAGDMTEIGERGINLSGGQKQRVSLARAAYQDADIYLLDDPLSAVDAHVHKHLWDNLIGHQGLLREKTRILVTHSIRHLEEVDKIVAIKEGYIVEAGTYNELMAARQSFYQLIEEHSLKRSQGRRKSSTGIQQDSTNENSLGSDQISLSDSTDTEIGSNDAVMEDKLINPSTGDRLNEEEEDELIAEEIMKKGGIEWTLIKAYAKACSLEIGVAIVLILITTELCTIGASLWLKHWITKTKEELENSLGIFLGVYSTIVVAYVALYVLYGYLTLAVARIRASELLHRKLISTVIRLPMSFFDTTPLGRIINRFSSDMYSIDEFLPWRTMDVIYQIIHITGTFIIISYSTPLFIVMIPIISAVFFIITKWFSWAARSLKRIESVSVSPIYQHIDESLNGVSTIRAMGVQRQFIEKNDELTDYNGNAFAAYMLCYRWVDYRLQVLSACIVLIVTTSAVLARNTVDPSLVGLSMSFVLNLSEYIMWLCKCYTEWQSSLVSVERVQEYTDKHTEAPETSAQVIPSSWPDQGRIEFQSYSTRYREGMELCIKDITFEVLPREKIGIVGRTGAGKSSLTLALFRIIEAANSQWARASDNSGYHERINLDASESTPLLEASDYIEQEEVDGGKIVIDGIDISTLGLSELRRHLAIIPQDPTLFAGNIRDNLDPFGEAKDSDLWEALDRAHLKDLVRSLPGGLSADVAQDGENFSVGQRSLICLARALLRKSRILILDEATASVDIETDELIQQTIRREFQDRTILTIAHRIKTVMDSTRIIVMEQGRVVEFDSPEILLRNQDSHFFKLAHQAGEILGGA